MDDAVFSFSPSQKNDDDRRLARASRRFKDFKSFKSFRRPKLFKNQIVETPKVPVYRMKGPRLQDERSPFTGESGDFHGH